MDTMNKCAKWLLVLGVMLVPHSLYAQYTPLTSILNLRLTTDSNGALSTVAATSTGVYTQLTPLSELRGRTDSNGALLITISGGGGGSGDVVGPGSATDNALVRYDSTTGKLIQNSTGLLTDTGDLSGIQSFGMVNNSGVDGTEEIVVTRYMGSTLPIKFIGQKARGTLASPANVQNGDSLLRMAARAYTGTFFGGPTIEALVDGAVTSAQGPATRWEFNTTVSNSGGSGSLALTLDSSQRAIFASTVSATGYFHAVCAKTGNYTLTSSESYCTGDVSGGAFSFTLPTAVGIAGRIYTIKKIDSSTTGVGIATTGGQTIDGAASASLVSQWDCISVLSNNVNWVSSGSCTPPVADPGTDSLFYFKNSTKALTAFTQTSGGVLAFGAGGTPVSSGALTANLPVIGGGAGAAPTVGTRSGNTTAYVTTTGAQTSGDCVKIDASGNHIANGSACGTGAGAGGPGTPLFTYVSATGTGPDNTATETSLIGTATIGSKTFPVNTCVAGTIVKALLSGIITTPAVPNDLTITAYMGATAVASGVITGTNVASLTGQTFNIDMTMGCTGSGASGSLVVDDYLITVGGLVAGAIVKMQGSGTTFDFAATQAFDIKAAWGSAQSGQLVKGKVVVAYIPGGGATTALDNLASVAINTALIPGTSDGAALGSTTKQWSDLFLAEGGVINFDNGDATLTQVGDVVTLAGADLKITTPGTASTSVATIDGAQTFTNKTIGSFASGGGTITTPTVTSTLDGVVCNTGTASATTNSSSETNLAVCTIPAAKLGLNGRVEVFALYKFVGTAAGKTYSIRHSATSGDTSAGTAVQGTAVANTTLSAEILKNVYNSNSASAQILYPTNNFGSSGGSTTANVTGAIDTANASYINFNCATTNSGDTCQVVAFTVTVVPGVCGGTAPSC